MNSVQFNCQKLKSITNSHCSTLDELLQHLSTNKGSKSQADKALIIAQGLTHHQNQTRELFIARVNQASGKFKFISNISQSTSTLFADKLAILYSMMTSPTESHSSPPSLIEMREWLVTLSNEIPADELNRDYKNFIDAALINFVTVYEKNILNSFESMIENMKSNEKKDWETTNSEHDTENTWKSYWEEYHRY